MTVGCVSDDGVGQVHPSFGQGMANLLAMGVVAKGADIRRLKPERRARGERRRYLSAAGDGLRDARNLAFAPVPPAVGRRGQRSFRQSLRRQISRARWNEYRRPSVIGRTLAGMTLQRVASLASVVLAVGALVTHHEAVPRRQAPRDVQRARRANSFANCRPAIAPVRRLPCALELPRREALVGPLRRPLPRTRCHPGRLVRVTTRLRTPG